ncbi:hypothetical protein SUGI_0192220 [Cryptomeria japonica]|nr:hypothetical protein SUGI_0192220 [Cryptomeria japonica]
MAEMLRRRNTQFLVFIVCAILLLGRSSTAIRQLPSENKAEMEKAVEEGCTGGEEQAEECLIRRSLKDPSIDYIYSASKP